MTNRTVVLALAMAIAGVTPVLAQFIPLGLRPIGAAPPPQPTVAAVPGNAIIAGTAIATLDQKTQFLATGLAVAQPIAVSNVAAYPIGIP